MPSYYPAEVMEQMRKDSDAAIDRLSSWMARVRINAELSTLGPDVDGSRFNRYKAAYTCALEAVD